ncbi:ornithine carbamoyltransferase [Ophidiomyces ophidiicola]|nr:ornithine carbamoyltransferase [Ophidiomyces ophidiicola]
MAKLNLFASSPVLARVQQLPHRAPPCYSHLRNLQSFYSSFSKPISMQSVARNTASTCRSMAIKQLRPYTTGSTSTPPRHLLSIADLTPAEFATLVRNASSHKQAIKANAMPESLMGALFGKTVAMLFSKRSTRTRVSTEGAVVKMGGHPMFLGKDDIQLGVNESLYDTSVVISSMVSCIVARVGPHSDIANLAKHSSVPVINALCDTFHPMQAIADFVTIHETFATQSTTHETHPSSLGLEGLKIAWVGDANNVLFDMAIAATKMGVDVAVATPKGYEMPPSILEMIQQAREGVQSPGKLTQTNVPEEAVKDADVIVTDTWVSMGQESEQIKRLEAFKGFQVTSDLAKRGGAKEHWKFMHCLPRHAEEVSDEVFYGDRSLVFPEAENRLWAAISALEGFVVRKGNIV